MDPHREFWNQQQQVLQLTLSRPQDHDKAIALFLGQHAMVHSAKLTRTVLWSFEDEVWEDMTRESIRVIPPNAEHSIAWLIWHITRIEDVTMNVLVAGSRQVLFRENWLNRLEVRACDTGNAMDERAIADLSASINIEALRGYRLAVGRRTREIVKRLLPAELKQKVQPSRLDQVMAEGAVTQASHEILDYWGKRTIAGLLLMPPTRHSLLHLNEALRVKQKCKSL